MVTLLDTVFEGLSGGKSEYRRGEVRAGGDETNKTFKATARHVATLSANPYLMVNKAPVTGDADTFLVHYYYPDASQLNAHLKPRVPSAVWVRISKTRC